MSETKRTPTPWLQDGAAVYSDVGTVAKCSTANSPAEAAANATFIVRACNSHAELLAACKEALTDYEGPVAQLAKLAGVHPYTIVPAMLREAIEKAEPRA